MAGVAALLAVALCLVAGADGKFLETISSMQLDSHSPYYYMRVPSPHQGEGKEDVLYLAERDGVRVVEVNSQGKIETEEMFPVTGSLLKKIHVKGDYLYVAQAKSLSIYDISNTLKPALVGRLRVKESDGIPCTVVVNKKHAYLFLTGKVFALSIVDVSDPTKPFSTNKMNIKGKVVDAVFQDNILYAFTLNGYLLSWDFTNPIVFGYKPEYKVTQPPAAVTVFKEFLYAAVDHDLRVYYTKGPAIEDAQRVNLGSPVHDVVWYRARVYAATDEGIAIIDVSDPRRASLVRTHPTNGRATSLRVMHQFKALYTDDSGLTCINIHPDTAKTPRPTLLPSDEDEDDIERRRKKLDGEEEEEEEDAKPKKRKRLRQRRPEEQDEDDVPKRRKPKSKAGGDNEDDDDDEPKKRRRRRVTTEEEEEDDEPKKKRRKATAEEVEEDGEGEKPKKRRRKRATAETDSDEEDDKPKTKRKSRITDEGETDVRDEDDKPKKRKTRITDEEDDDKPKRKRRGSTAEAGEDSKPKKKANKLVDSEEAKAGQDDSEDKGKSTDDSDAKQPKKRMTEEDSDEEVKTPIPTLKTDEEEEDVEKPKKHKITPPPSRSIDDDEQEELDQKKKHKLAAVQEGEESDAVTSKPKTRASCGIIMRPAMKLTTATVEEGMQGWTDLEESKLVEVPQWLLKSEAYIPTSKISESTEITVSCCHDVCDAFVFFEHCMPCSSQTNGGLPGILLSEGWSPSTCGPQFRVTDTGRTHPTVVFRKQMVKNEKEGVVASLTKDLRFVGFAISPGKAICQELSSQEECGYQKLCKWDSPSNSCAPSIPRCEASSSGDSKHAKCTACAAADL
eukprot:TRINITY_DN29947_c0_g1_i3.p1 TRINITY_DN29947_c0_g1~~TRINITY_DN29947_c0_g1_i3.p1  ORF type:complete len:892 (+),score=330.82 TRINITY_DN29947_c0_g1_i3:150-2678(+)